VVSDLKQIAASNFNKQQEGCCKIALRGRNLFEKRFSSPRPIFQKLSAELLLSFTIKAIPTFYRISKFLYPQAECLSKGINIF